MESWAGALDAGAVSIAYLGDLVYPVGIRPIGSPEHPSDTLALHAQLRPILDGDARENGVEILFVPGNHDWGNVVGPEGRSRLAIMEEKVDSWAATGLPVRMVPSGGTIGPVTTPVGSDLQLVVLDTQAWLGGSDTERAEAAAAPPNRPFGRRPLGSARPPPPADRGQSRNPDTQPIRWHCRRGPGSFLRTSRVESTPG